MDNRRMATPRYQGSREKEIYFHGVISGILIGAFIATIVTMGFIDLTGGI